LSGFFLSQFVQEMMRLIAHSLTGASCTVTLVWLRTYLSIMYLKRTSKSEITNNTMFTALIHY